jgi:CheY-like chemotaxis protein
MDGTGIVDAPETNFTTFVEQRRSVPAGKDVTRPRDPARRFQPASDARAEPQGMYDGPRKIRVLLADDHALLRAGLAGLLADEPDIEVVGQAGDGQAALELAVEVIPDVILMDVTMPRLNGIEATRRIAAILPQVRIIGLSMHDQDAMSAAMRKAGAAAYLSKDGRSETLLETIRACCSSSPAGV